MDLSWNSALLRRVCRALPPPLAFRLFGRLIASRLEPQTEFQSARALFGKASISSSLEDIQDAMFAYLGTSNFAGLVLARLLLRPGETVFEIGANVGTDTLSLAALVGPLGRVVAVEPLDESASRLEERVTSNRLDQVTVLRKAVSNASSIATIVPGPPSNSGTAHLTRDWAAGSSTDSLEVETVTLDSLADTYGAPRLLWLDIEGYELKALQGATELLRDSRPFVLTEVDTRYLQRAGNTIHELLELVQTHGYEVFRASARSLPRFESETDERRHLHEDWLLVPKEQGESVPTWRRLNKFARLFNWYPGEKRRLLRIATR